jgi:hypothetical protein
MSSEGPVFFRLKRRGSAETGEETPVVVAVVVVLLVVVVPEPLNFWTACWTALSRALGGPFFSLGGGSTPPLVVALGGGGGAAVVVSPPEFGTNLLVVMVLGEPIGLRLVGGCWWVMDSCTWLALGLLDSPAGAWFFLPEVEEDANRLEVGTPILG